MQTSVPFVPLVSAQALPQRSALRRAFWIGIFGIAVIVAATARPPSVESALGAAMIVAAALLPAGLWVYQRAKGLPLFPVYALPHVWTFGMLLLYEHPIVLLFPPDHHFRAALTVTAGLLIGTAVW